MVEFEHWQVPHFNGDCEICEQDSPPIDRDCCMRGEHIWFGDWPPSRGTETCGLCLVSRPSDG